MSAVADLMQEVTGVDPPRPTASVEARFDAIGRKDAYRVVDLAHTADDPAVYAWANAHCSGVGAGSACDSLNLERWAQLEPGNATAWLAVAERRRQSKDAAGARRALDAASRATTVEHHDTALVRTLREALPADATPLVRMQLDAAAIGQATILPMNASSVVGICGRSDVDPADRKVCDRLAQVFERSGTTSLDLIVAGSVGRASGWSAERLHALGRRRLALEELAVAGGAESDTLDCDALARQRRVMDDWAALGELGRLNAKLAASGESIETLAARADRRRAELKAATAITNAAAAADTTTGGTASVDTNANRVASGAPALRRDR